MKKALCVLGPTAVGKTALSLFIAPYIQGVLFSADSVQVYRGLDIISGKDKNSYKDTPVKLLDISSPEYSFNVSDYLKKFKQDLKSLDSNMIPIIVGGTGFYISALLNGVETSEIKPDLKLRKFLEQKDILELQKILEKKNPEKFSHMNHSDRNNPRRLVRAIEISENKKSYLKEESVLNTYDVCIIGLELPRETLNEKINERVEKRIEEGALEEMKVLFDNYENLSPQVKRANGYKQLFEYKLGRKTLDESIKSWEIAEHQNAKKQMTFFKKMNNITWFNPSVTSQDEILAYVQEWYNKKI